MDFALRDKLKNIEREGPEVEVHVINCTNQKTILDHVLQADQSMRQEGAHIDPATDQQNLSLVVSILKKCGMPTLSEVDPEHMQAIWLVIQHASNTYRKAYFPLFETAARNGDLDQTHVAMMKDRMLMDDGLPQVYGTQVVLKQESGRYELYTLEAPGSVDKRRIAIGFGPLHEYLKRWSITFDVVQDK